MRALVNGDCEADAVSAATRAFARGAREVTVTSDTGRTLDASRLAGLRALGPVRLRVSLPRAVDDVLDLLDRADRAGLRTDVVLPIAEDTDSTAARIRGISRGALPLRRYLL